MILVSLIPVIMIECTIFYRGICYLFGIVFCANSYLIGLWIFMHHAYVSSIKYESRYTISFCVSLNSFLYNPLYYSIWRNNATLQVASQTRAYIQTHPLRVEIFLKASQFRTDLAYCCTPYSQCRSTTRKSNTLLWYFGCDLPKKRPLRFTRSVLRTVFHKTWRPVAKMA
jgi:hypothetical protein